MKSITLNILAICLILGTTNIVAQTGSIPPLPPGPLLGQIANNDAWEVILVYGEEKKNESGAAADATNQAEISPPERTPSDMGELISELSIRPKKATLIRTSPNWHVKIDGQKSSLSMDYWSNGQTIFVDSPRMKDSMAISAQPDLDSSFATQLISAFSRRSFPDLDWISKENYAGVQNAGGRRCLVFKNEDTIAWIDSETRFPVRWQRGEETRGFKRLSPPASPIKLPKAMSDVLEDIKKDQERLRRKPQRGG